MSVSIGPGQMAWPLMAKHPPSLATHFVDAMPPPLASAYAGPLREIRIGVPPDWSGLPDTAPPSLPEIELILTILPPPWRCMTGYTACVHRYVPRAITSISELNVASSRSASVV